MLFVTPCRALSAGSAHTGHIPCPPSPPGEAAEPCINHSRGTSSHLDGIGPSATPRRIVNTKHMLCLKLIIILGSHQLLVIGSPFAEITESSRVEIQPLPGSFSNEMSPGERWPFCRGQRDTGRGMASNNRLRAPCATLMATHEHRGTLGDAGVPSTGSRALGTDPAGQGQVFSILVCCLIVGVSSRLAQRGYFYIYFFYAFLLKHQSGQVGVGRRVGIFILQS